MHPAIYARPVEKSALSHLTALFDQKRAEGTLDADTQTAIERQLSEIKRGEDMLRNPQQTANRDAEELVRVSTERARALIQSLDS